MDLAGLLLSRGFGLASNRCRRLEPLLDALWRAFMKILCVQRTRAEVSQVSASREWPFLRPKRLTRLEEMQMGSQPGLPRADGKSFPQKHGPKFDLKFTAKRERGLSRHNCR